MKMKMSQSIKQFPIVLASLLFIAGCNESHLAIFPPLDDPSLISKQLSVAQMHDDIDALVEGVIERHPDISAYADLSEIKEAIVRYKAEVTAPMTRVEFYRVVGKLSHHFNDGHSFLIWPYQEYQQLKEDEHKSFPFEVIVTKSGDILIKQSYQQGDTSLAAGSRLLSVNGIPASILLEKMQAFTGGESKYLREQVVGYRFSIGLWAAFGFIDDFKLELEQNGQQFQLAINRKQDWQLQQVQQSNQEHYYKKLQTGVGYLYLEHFDIDPNDFEDFIDHSFAQIKQDGIHSLLIDIRNNPGGNTDSVTYLSRHLANKPFRLVSSVKEKLNLDNRGIFNHKGEKGEIVSTQWNDWEEPVSESKRFTGKSYLLISPVSYSSAIVLATTLKDNGFATLVGETTGGFANQTAQGNLFNLPNSQLRAYVATKTLVRPSGDDSRNGVEPHYVASSSIDDITAQKDVAIELILDMINKTADES